MPSTNSAIFFIVLIFIQHNGCHADCYGKEKPGLWDKVKETVEVASENDVLKFGLKTAAVATTVIAAAPLVVAAAGFGTAGIAAGSTAAAIQATWFGGAITGYTGAAFATLQSIGAAGLGLGAKSAVVAATGATLKTLDVLSEKEDDNNKENCSPDNNKHSVEF